MNFNFVLRYGFVNWRALVELFQIIFLLYFPLQTSQQRLRLIELFVIYNFFLLCCLSALDKKNLSNFSFPGRQKVLILIRPNALKFRRKLLRKIVECAKEIFPNIAEKEKKAFKRAFYERINSRERKAFDLISMFVIKSRPIFTVFRLAHGQF